MNYGFIPDIENEEDYIFGASVLSGVIVNPIADWTLYLPKKELQDLNNLEPYACVAFTILNCIEILIKKQYGRTENYSDRFLANISDTQSGGNTPKKVADTLRKMGVVMEEVWPVDDTVFSFETYYAEVPSELYRIAKEFNEKYELKYEKVGSNPYSILEALKRSPLGISVTAWHKGADGLFYRPEGSKNNHFTTLISHKKDTYWEVFDSYDQHIKRIPWNTSFDVIRRYYVQERLTKVSFLDKIWLFIKKYIWR